MSNHDEHKNTGLVSEEQFNQGFENGPKWKEALKRPGSHTFIGDHEIPDGARVVAHTLCEIDPETGEHTVHEILAYLVYDKDGNLTMEIAEAQRVTGSSDYEKSEEEQLRKEAGLIVSSTGSAYVIENMQAKCPNCDLNLDKMTDKGRSSHAPEFAICFGCGFVFELDAGPIKRASDSPE